MRTYIYELYVNLANFVERCGLRDTEMVRHTYIDIFRIFHIYIYVDAYFLNLYRSIYIRPRCMNTLIHQLYLDLPNLLHAAA